MPWRKSGAGAGALVRLFAAFNGSSPFDDTKIPFRGVVEHFERWPVQVTVIRRDRLFQALELDHHDQLIYSRLVDFSRLASNDHAPPQRFQRGPGKLRIFGKSRRIRHRLVAHHPISPLGHRVLLMLLGRRSATCDSALRAMTQDSTMSRWYSKNENAVRRAQLENELRLKMVGPNGLEPSTSSVSRKRSNQTELRAYTRMAVLRF